MPLLTSQTMIGQAIKLRWKLSLQIRGTGAVRIIATDYYAPESEGAPARIRQPSAPTGGEVLSYDEIVTRRHD